MAHVGKVPRKFPKNDKYFVNSYWCREFQPNIYVFSHLDVHSFIFIK